MMRYSNILTFVILFNLLAYVLIRLRTLIYKTAVFKPMIWKIKLSLAPIVVLFGGALLALVF